MLLDLGRKSIPDAIKELPEDAIIVSHSQLGSWDRCSQAWDFGYRQGWTSPSSPAMQMGSTIHKFLEVYYKCKKINPKWVPEGYWTVVEQYLKTVIAQVTSHSQMQQIATAGNLVKRYIFEEAPEREKYWRILEVEKHFLTKLTTPRGLEYYLQIYIDLLFEEQGKINLLDNKSSGDSKFWSEMAIAMDSQGPTYASVLRELDIAVHNIYYSFFNTYDYKKPPEATKLFKLVRSYRTQKELDIAVEDTGKQVDDMFHPEHKVQIRRSRRKDCDRCWFKEPCLMTTKGIDPTPFLEAKFIRKSELVESEKESLDSPVDEV